MSLGKIIVVILVALIFISFIFFVLWLLFFDKSESDDNFEANGLEGFDFKKNNMFDVYDNPMDMRTPSGIYFAYKSQRDITAHTDTAPHIDHTSPHIDHIAQAYFDYQFQSDITAHTADIVHMNDSGIDI